MTTLGIETATQVCGAALVRDGAVIAERFVNEKNVHAERLMELIREVTGGTGSVRGIDGIAVSIGPGSFTGLRIGASVAKGLAYGGGKLLIGVPTLEALLERARSNSALLQTGAELMGVLPARRGEFFTMRESTKEVRILGGKSALEECRRESLILTGNIAGLRLDEEGAPRILQVEESLRHCRASTVALIGERLFLEGRHDDLHTLEPRYLLEFFLRVDMMERT